MRRTMAFAAAAVALFSAACGGGDNDSTNASNNDSNDNSGASAAAGFTTVCGGREGVAVGAAGASAQQSGSVDFSSVAEGLRRARDAAPSEIKGDFTVFVEAATPFFEAMAKANGNYMSAAQDPAFQAAAEKLGSDEVQTASQNINNWFAEHCG